MIFFLRTIPHLLPIARKSLSNHIDWNPEYLFFFVNATTAINLIANSWKLGNGDVILPTDLEYGAMRWVCEKVAQKTGCSIQILEIPHLCENPNEIVAFIETHLRPPVKVLFFSHGTSPTGMVLPARELCRLAEIRGFAMVVDGAHAVGTLELSQGDIQANCYGSNLHNWLGAPTGSAFLAYKPETVEGLEPLIVSWGYHKPSDIAQKADGSWGSTPSIRKIEITGTIDLCPWLVTPNAIEFQNNLGLKKNNCNAARIRQMCTKPSGPLNLATTSHPRIIPNKLLDGRLSSLVTKPTGLHAEISLGETLCGNWTAPTRPIGTAPKSFLSIFHARK